MLDEELRQNGPPDTFDNTMLQKECGCPRELYWFLRGIDYRVSPPYFAWGRAWGAGLNAFYECDESLEIRLLIGLKAATALWEAESPEGRVNDTLENLQRVFTQYAQCYGRENWTQGKEHGELGFAFPIPGTQIYYAGAIDAYIEWPGYGALLREDKTTGGYVTANYMGYWMRASQVTGYLWALAQILGEVPFGALINMVSKRKSKNMEDQFARNMPMKSEWQLNEFMRDTVEIADRIRKRWDTGTTVGSYPNWLWPKLGERVYLKCSGGAGTSPCLYNSLCAVEADPWTLDETYDYEDEYSIRSEKWAPWERKGDT